MSSTWTRLPMLVAVLASAGLACSYASALISPTATEPAPEPTESPTILSDDFADSTGDWGTGTDEVSSVEYVNEALQFIVLKDNYITWSTAGTDTYQDVHIEVTALNPSPATSPAFGIICDQQTPHTSYYFFAVNSDGEYAIGKAATGEKDVFLTNNDEWAKSPSIKKDAPNYRIGADCGNGQLTLYVNGRQIDSVSDSTYTDGGVALFAWSGKLPGAQVSFDDFQMSKLK